MAPVDPELVLLRSQRDRCLAQIRKLHARSQALTTPLLIRRFLVHVASLEEYRQTLQRLQDRIHALEVAAGVTTDFAAVDDAEDMLIDIALAAEAHKEEDNKPNPTNLGKARLPKITLPKFQGDIKNWVLFKETFESLIHQNNQLTQVEKIHFLMGCLEGTARSICSGIPPTAENYNILWSALRDKYDDQTLIANSYLEQILGYKKAQIENAHNLNHFLDTFHSTVEALRKLQISDLLDYILAYLAFVRLPQETQKAYENAKRTTAYLSYDELIKFVKEQVKICVRTNPTSRVTGVRAETPHKSHIHSFLVSRKHGDKTKCLLCSGEVHKLNICPKFLENTPRSRYEIVKSQNLCLNCLSNHKIAQCSSPYSCRYCKSRHHSLLHFQGTADSGNKLDGIDGKPQKIVALTNYINNNDSTVMGKSQCDNKMLLATVVVFALSKNGGLKQCRFLLDSGSQMNCITEECSRFLKLKVRPCSSKIYGLGLRTTQVQGCLTITITSIYDKENRYTFDAVVIRKIVDKLPGTIINRENLKYLSNVPLADPDFHLPNKIDGILGVDMFTRILTGDIIQGPPNFPIGLSSKLGFIVMGSIPKLTTIPPLTASTFSDHSHAFCTFSDTDALENSLKQFWEIEDVPSIEESTGNQSDYDKCEEIFRTTHYREDSGRYVVKLPFKMDPSLLGDSHQHAKTRFLHLEKKFRTNPFLKTHYTEIIDDYLRQGHMTPETPISDFSRTEHKIPTDGKSHYFIPHHGVCKIDSTTTPLRVVFDASCKTTSSYSLNDILYSGPKLQTDVVAVLLRFRLGKFGFTADLKQMFRQIFLDQADRCYQKILWRRTETDPLGIYTLNTVTFGLKCSPYLANRVIKQLGEDEKTSFPEATDILKHDIYVDDVVYSVTEPEMGFTLFNQLTNIFRKGGFEVHKWATNCSDLIGYIPAEKQYPFDFQKHCLKVLGMYWDPKNDCLNFHFRLVSTPLEKTTCTKRTILSTVARCFDPLGFLAPALLLAKLLVQELWRQKLDWDDTPPDHIKKRWENFYQELPSLSEIKVPRFLNTYPETPVTLVGFADACVASYGAAVYLRTTSPATKVHLLYAKTKVAPIKPVTIPKLE